MPTCRALTTVAACALAATSLGCKSGDSGVTPRRAPTGAPVTTASGFAPPPRSSATPNPTSIRSAPARGSVSADSPPAKPPKRAYRVAAVGDSLTDYQSHGGGYLRYLQKQCPETRIDNFAKGAHMLNQIRRRFEATVHNRPRDSYTHVIVWGGVNDLYSDLTAGRTPDKAAADLGVIYRKARNKGAKVVAITVSPWGGFSRYHNERRQAYTLQLNDWIRQQERQGDVDAVVDAYALLSCGDPVRLCPDYAQLKSDGLHLGQRGHEVLGKALVRAAFDDCR